MKKKTLWVTRTAVMIAVLVALQAVTKPLGQFVTGSCVNLVLGVAAMAGGFWCGMTVALLSPFFAFLLGIGPAFIQIVPAISVGNMIFAAIVYIISGKAIRAGGARGLPVGYLGVTVAAVCKFAALLLLVVKLILPLLGLAEKQAAVISLSFSWPQLVTAAIGGVLAASVAPALIRATKRSEA